MIRQALAPGTLLPVILGMLAALWWMKSGSEEQIAHAPEVDTHSIVSDSRVELGVQLVASVNVFE